ncbi:uncharacterized protein METZ01_LOCUS427167, partial [marine metagenome]
YSFTDESFSGAALQSIIGHGYSGGKNINQALDSDYFGWSVSLDGNRLAVGAPYGDGSGNGVSASGEVHLYTFSNSTFSGGELAATIGHGYSGATNGFNQTLDTNDNLGAAVSLDGNRLAVGARLDDGSGNSRTYSGAAYLYTFSDSAFSGGALDAVIGHGYTGGKNVSQSLDTSDYFGFGISLDGNRLAVGAPFGDGYNNGRSSSGEVYLYTAESSSDSVSSAVFATNSSSDSTITPTTITTLLSAATNVVLQANNDITVSAAVTANN